MRISLVPIFFLLAGAANAAPAASPTPAPSPAPKAWSVAWYNSYQSSLHASGDAFKRSSYNSTLIVNYLTSDRLRIQGAFGAAQAIQPSALFKMINPEFRGFYLLNPGESKLKFYAGPTAALPFGTDAQDESMIFSLGVGGRAVYKNLAADGSGFRFYYDLTFNKNFHKYETSVFADVNNQLSLNHMFYGEYNFNDAWNLNATVAFSSLWNYFGYLSNNYSVEQELDFQATDWLTIYLAHVRGGDLLAPNGQNYSFGIFDRDSSRITIGTILSF